MLPHASPSPSAHRPSGVAVACSGGRDSTALLHATVCASRSLGLQVVALHVHHGLNPQADGWLAHLQAQVAQWAAEGLPVRLMWERLDGRPGPGESIEAWARTGRHQALQRMARRAGTDLLLLAHHRRDQAETFLLQALRGAGAAGLAAMPQQQWRDGVCWARPWLDQPREAVEAYVRQHGLSHIEDSSNSDLRFARNRLRHALWPVLTQAAPGAEAALAQSAAWAQQALALQQEIAAQDLAVWAPALPPAPALQPVPALQPTRALRTAAWAALSPARLSNLLRAWLRLCGEQAAPASLIERLMNEVPAADVGRWPWGRLEVRLYRGELSVARARRAPDRPLAGFMSTAADIASSSDQGLVTDVIPVTDMANTTGPTDTTDTTGAPVLTLDLSRPGRHPVPQWRGAIEVLPAEAMLEGVSRGVSASRLIKVELRPREGGIQFQAHARGIPRSLKKCWQTAGIPAPQREGPLLWADGALLFVPGLGLDARVQETAAQGLLALRWHPDAC
jgi:tRNA(Ile)-lysidine synthase